MLQVTLTLVSFTIFCQATAHCSTCGRHSPTHLGGHTLDLFITRDSQVVQLSPIDPPTLSDHSFVVVNIDCMVLSDSSEANYHEVRRWRDIDVDAFADDLSRTELVLSPPDDVAEAFACYDQTLRTLLDKHAPLQR